MSIRIFIAGGAGFIGSHTVLALLRAKFEVHVFDSFTNSSPRALQRVQELAGAPVSVTKGDVNDPKALTEALKASRPDAVIHFAGLKAVGESEEDPLSYYTTNAQGMVNLLRGMVRAGVDASYFRPQQRSRGIRLICPMTRSTPSRR